jgi:hypothetical protein
MSSHGTRAAPAVRFDETEPLIVRPKTAMRMLACGETRFYELVASGEIESFKDGGSRKVLVRSIHAYIERLRNQSKAAAQRPDRVLDTSPAAG